MSKVIHYKIRNNCELITPCPYEMTNTFGRLIMVNSFSCNHCRYYGGSNYDDSINCNHK